MRLDKLCAELNIGSRSDVKKIIRSGQIQVNGNVVKSPDTHVDENTAVILYQGKEFYYSKLLYFMLNKPAGVVSATEDSHDKTVIDLLKEQYPDLKLSDTFPVGRLDKDTVGLLLLTNDGELAHRLLSPRSHVDKTYFVRLDSTLSDEGVEKIESGLDIGEDKLTLPAKLKIVSTNEYFITIHEGKFHQIKRMFHAVGCEVIYLKRISMGSLSLDESLPEGKIRPLTPEEVKILRK